VSDSSISWVLCKSAPRSRQITMPASTPPLSFLQARCPSCRPTNSVKALKATQHTKHTKTDRNTCKLTKLRSDAKATTNCTELLLYVNHATLPLKLLLNKQQHLMFTSTSSIHTYICFTAVWTLAAITRVSRYQNQSGFYWSKGQLMAGQQLGHMQICTSPRPITMPTPHHSVFTDWMPFLPPNQQHQSTGGKYLYQ